MISDYPDWRNLAHCAWLWDWILKFDIISVTISKPVFGYRERKFVVLFSLIPIIQQEKPIHLNSYNKCWILLQGKGDRILHYHFANLIAHWYNCGVKEICYHCVCYFSKKLHVISDEIYALSVFEGEFCSSVSQIDHLPDPGRTHMVWGFSKVSI